MTALPFTRAIVRGVADSYPRALTRDPHPPAVSVERARAQHAAYVAALEAAGVAVTALPADRRYPDCCFVEDQALALGELVLVLRSGSPTRRGEAEAVATALAAERPIRRMAAPATADGGDLLVLGTTLVIGRGPRTNAAGAAELRQAAASAGLDTLEVAVPSEGLHLKSVCSPLGPDLLLAAAGTLRVEDFPAATQVLWVPAEEAPAANAVSLGRRVLVAAGFPRTAELLARHGLEPLPLDNSEFRKRDGALTCLSVRYG